jgi:peptidoglycan-associated lipoprotein
MKRFYLIIGLFLVIVVGVSTGCDKKQLIQSDSNSEGSMSQLAASSSDVQNDGSGLKSVFFDYNKYAIRVNDKKSLKYNAAYFLKNKKAKILIEGHCDERGTDAYNIALGDRRAKAAMQYLVNAGVSKKRLKTISYGESRPLDSGHDEAAWAKNRRTNFVVTME